MAKEPEVVRPAAAPPPPDVPAPGQELEIDDKNVISQYANFFSATGTLEEVILDFGNRNKENMNKIKIDSRVVVSIWNAKRILAALAQTINMFEERFGKIELDPRKRIKNP
jgi:preprotein translocase subunit Sec61beta